MKNQTDHTAPEAAAFETERTPTPLCQHIKDDGVRCGSPALKHRTFCYYHYRSYTRIMPASDIDYFVPVLDSEASVQIAIRQVLESLLAGHLKESKASIALNAIRLSAQSLRQPKSPASEDISTDFTGAMRNHLMVDYFTPMDEKKPPESEKEFDIAEPLPEARNIA